MDDDAIRTLVIRLSRAHPSGGEVIERAAILAEGADFDAVVGWIIAHDGRPEAKAAPSAPAACTAPASRRRPALGAHRPATCCRPARSPERRRYTTYRNVYAADGPLCIHSARQ